MLNSNCKDCKNIIKCNSRYVNAIKGDKIYCPDGSVMVVDQNYQKEITPQKYKPKIELKVHYCEACINYGKRTIISLNI